MAEWLTCSSVEKAAEKKEERVFLMNVADLGQHDGTCYQWLVATRCALHYMSPPGRTSQMMTMIDDVQYLSPLLLQDDQLNHPEILIADFAVALLLSNAKYRNDRHLNVLEWAGEVKLIETALKAVFPKLEISLFVLTRGKPLSASES